MAHGSEEDKRKARELDKKGFSLRDIGKALDPKRSASTIWKWLNPEKWKAKQEEARKLRELLAKTTQLLPTDQVEEIVEDPLELLVAALSPPDGWLQHFSATVECKMLEVRNPSVFCNYYQREIDPNVDCASHARLVIEHYVATHPETEQAEVPAEATGEPLPSMPTIKIPISFGMAHLLLALGIWFGFIQLWIHVLQPVFPFEGSQLVGWVISFVLLGLVIALRKRMFEWKENLWLKIHGY